MIRPRDALLAFLAVDASGMVLAAAVAALGAAAVAAAPSAWVAAPGWVLVVLGSLLALLSMRHLARRARIRRTHPPPGRLVAVGRHRMHVLGEGTARDGRPPVVWFAGHGPAGSEPPQRSWTCFGSTRPASRLAS